MMVAEIFYLTGNEDEFIEPQSNWEKVAMMLYQAFLQYSDGESYPGEAWVRIDDAMKLYEAASPGEQRWTLSR